MSIAAHIPSLTSSLFAIALIAACYGQWAGFMGWKIGNNLEDKRLCAPYVTRSCIAMIVSQVVLVVAVAIVIIKAMASSS